MRFVVLGDLHYSSFTDPVLAKARDRIFRLFFQQVARVKADLVFAIGDTTNNGTIEEFKTQDRLLEEANLKIIRLPGNHDADSLEKAEMAPFFLGGYPSISSLELFTSFDFGPARFVLLDTARVKMPNINWSGYVSPEQLGWLKTKIEEFNRASSPNYFFLLGHHPLRGTTTRSEENWMNIDNSQEVRGIMAGLKKPVGVYFCGHNHSNSLFGPEEQGWRFIQSGAPLTCKSFRLIEVNEQSLKLETIDISLDSQELQKDLDLVIKNMEHFSFQLVKEVGGAHRDRFLSLTGDKV